MRAIIIEEERFSEICETLRFKAEAIKNGRFTSVVKPPEMSQSSFEILIQDVHRSFHCEFVRWAQSHGAPCVPK